MVESVKLSTKDRRGVESSAREAAPWVSVPVCCLACPCLKKQEWLTPPTFPRNTPNTRVKCVGLLPFKAIRARPVIVTAPPLAALSLLQVHLFCFLFVSLIPFLGVGGIIRAIYSGEYTVQHTCLKTWGGSSVTQPHAAWELTQIEASYPPLHPSPPLPSSDSSCHCCTHSPVTPPPPFFRYCARLLTTMPESRRQM